MLVRYNSVFVPLCSPNTCKDVFNPNVTAFQSNCADGLHFNAFHYYCCACSKTSISINKYIQKAEELENDAGFLVSRVDKARRAAEEAEKLSTRL